MPRPRKNDPSARLAPLLDEFAARIGSALERFTTARIEQQLGQARGKATLNERRRRAQITCYYPGCSNLAAPRFGMFCAALHKELSKAKKAQYRVARA